MSRYLRPTEVERADRRLAGLAQHELGWTPTVRAPELARIMVDHDVAAIQGREVGTWLTWSTGVPPRHRVVS
jgi:GDPmannose 4,6-dehydratase